MIRTWTSQRLPTNDRWRHKAPAQPANHICQLETHLSINLLITGEACVTQVCLPVLGDGCVTTKKKIETVTVLVPAWLFLSQRLTQCLARHAAKTDRVASVTDMRVHLCGDSSHRSAIIPHYCISWAKIFALCRLLYMDYLSSCLSLCSSVRLNVDTRKREIILGKCHVMSFLCRSYPILWSLSHSHSSSTDDLGSQPSGVQGGT